MLWNVPIRVRVSADRRVMGNRDGVADGWNWLRGAVAWSAVEWRSIDNKKRRKVAIGQQGWSDTCYKVGRREGMSRRQGNKGKRSGVAAGALELVVELVEREGSSSGAVGAE